MRLAFYLFNYFPFGGLERNFLRIAQTCAARGHEVHVFTMQWSGKKPDAIRVTEVPHRGFTNHGRCVSFVTRLTGALRPSDYDLRVGFNRMPGLDLYYAADVCYVLDVARRRARWARRTPRYRTYAAYEKAVFGRESLTEILYLSEQQKQDYMHVYGTPDERFHYLPPGVDRKRILANLGCETRRHVRQALSLREDDRMVLMVGSDFRRKGVGRAIRALASLPGDLKSRTHLFVIGKGNSRAFKKLSGRLDVDKRVHFLGSREDVPRFMAGADALLHPALSENTGNAIVEALVAGLPVLATANCGYAFHVEKARAGEIIRGTPFLQQDLNQTLAAVLTSPERAKWKENALRYADQTDLYSRPEVAAGVMEALTGRQV